jgi:hypothetical protein
MLWKSGTENKVIFRRPRFFWMRPPVIALEKLVRPAGPALRFTRDFRVIRG